MYSILADVLDRRSLDSYADAIIHAEIPLFQALVTLSRDELKYLCRLIEVDETGTEKIVLAKRISRSIATRAISNSQKKEAEEQESNDDTEKTHRISKTNPAELEALGQRRNLSSSKPNQHEKPMKKSDELVPTFRSLRKFLDIAIPTDVDLDAFILDNFYEIKKRLTMGMERKAKINLLFECVDRSNILGNLLIEHPELNEKAKTVIEYEDSADI